MKLRTIIAIALIGAVFSGCAKYTVSGGDQKIVAEGASLPYGVTYCKIDPAPKVDKLPIKVKGWSSLSRDVRQILKPYVHTSGDYLPVQIKLEMGNQGSNTESGFGNGYLVLKQSFSKGYGILITSWNEDSDILMDIPVSGECTAWRKSEVGKTGFDTSYINKAMSYSDQVAAINVVKKLEENRDQINKLYEEYKKSKEVF